MKPSTKAMIARRRSRPLRDPHQRQRAARALLRLRTAGMHTAAREIAFPQG